MRGDWQQTKEKSTDRPDDQLGNKKIDTNGIIQLATRIWAIAQIFYIFTREKKKDTFRI